MLLAQAENEASRTPELNQSIAHLTSWNREAVARKEQTLRPRHSVCVMLNAACRSVGNMLDAIRGYYLGAVLSATWWGLCLQTNTFGVVDWVTKNGTMGVLAACSAVAAISLPILLLSLIMCKPVAPVPPATSRTRAAIMLTIYMAGLCGAIIAVWARKTNLI